MDLCTDTGKGGRCPCLIPQSWKSSIGSWKKAKRNCGKPSMMKRHCSTSGNSLPERNGHTGYVPVAACWNGRSRKPLSLLRVQLYTTQKLVHCVLRRLGAGQTSTGRFAPLRWLPPATLLWTCHLGTPCFASCSQTPSFIKYAIFSIGNKV